MNLIKKTKLKKNKTTTITTSHTIHKSLNNNNLLLPKLVSRKKLNKLILKGGKYVRNYNVSSVHSKKTQSKNGSLKRTLTALKNKNYFTKSQKQDGGFIIDAIRLKYKLYKFKSFLKKYRKEEIEVQKYIDSYTGKGNILELLKDDKYNKSREYIIHYRKLKIFEFLKNNKDNEKDIKTLDIDGKFTDAESKIKGIGKSLKQFEKEQKKEIPNLKKQTKTFKKNSKDISKLIAYFEKHLRKYYEEIKLIRERYKQFQGKSKLDSEAKSDIKKYQRFAKDIDYILSFTDMEQKKMIDLKNNIATILDKGQTFSTQFKDFDSSKFGEDLEKWKENYTRIYENLDITSDIDDIVEIYTVTINNFEIIKNQLIIIRMSKGGDEKNIGLMTEYISKLKSNKDDILEKVKKYIVQLKIALVIEKPFKDVDTAITIIIGSIQNSIVYNEKVLKNINEFNKSVGTTGISKGGSWLGSWSGGGSGKDEGFSKGIDTLRMKTLMSGGTSKAPPTVRQKSLSFFEFNIPYENFCNLSYFTVAQKIGLYDFSKINTIKIRLPKTIEVNFLEATIEQQYTTLKDLFTIWIYLNYWSKGEENSSTTTLNIFDISNSKFNSDILLNFIRLIFIYELLNYKKYDKNPYITDIKNTNLYKNLIDILKKLFTILSNKLTNNFIEINTKLGNNSIKFSNTIFKNPTLKKLTDDLKTNTDKMNDYELSDISIKNSTQQLTLKNKLKQEFIVNYMDNLNQTPFYTEYEKHVSSLQVEINEWKKHDNPFKKAVALSILHIRLNDDPTTDQKTDIEGYIEKINDDTEIDLKKICDSTSSGTPGGPGTGNQGQGTGNQRTGNLGPGTGQQKKQVPVPVPAKVSPALPNVPASTSTNTSGMLNLSLNLTNDANVSNNFNIIIESSSELATTLEKLTPSGNDTASTMPEPYAKIIKKLTIINECVSNLKLIEPKFNIENAKYAKVDLDYNWAQNYFKKETEFGVTSDISTIKTASDKTIYQSPPDKTKKDFSNDDFLKLLGNSEKETDDYKSIFENLNTEKNLLIFKEKFEGLSPGQKCSMAKGLLDNTKNNATDLKTYLKNYKNTNCKSKPQGISS